MFSAASELSLSLSLSLPPSVANLSSLQHVMCAYRRIYAQGFSQSQVTSTRIVTLIPVLALSIHGRVWSTNCSLPTSWIGNRYRHHSCASSYIPCTITITFRFPRWWQRIWWWCCDAQASDHRRMSWLLSDRMSGSRVQVYNHETTV